MASQTKSTILNLLAQRVVIGDGGYINCLERRGYVTAGFYTPEVVLEHPDAVAGLHKEFVRAGSDVIQALTFYTTDGKLQISDSAKMYDGDELNKAACELANKAAKPSGLMVCGGVTPTPTYAAGKGKQIVQAEYEKICRVFVENEVDFILAEFFGHIEELEWAIEVIKKYEKPVACTMRIGTSGDLSGVTPGECAVRMAKKGADIVGLNCCFDYKTQLKVIKLMKDALDTEGLHPYLMTQPLGFRAPEVDNLPQGYHDLPESLLALEPRILTRWECRDYARKAFELGVRYIGGCCGMDSLHIREMAEELAEERGFRPPGKDHNKIFGAANKQSMIDSQRKKAGRDYWMNVMPRCGQPNCKGIYNTEDLV